MTTDPTPVPRRFGPGFLTSLGLLFVGFQLAGIIAWPWFWVVFPFTLNVFRYILAIGIILVASVKAAGK